MANREIKFRLLSPSKNIIGYEKWYEGSFNKETGIPSAYPCWLYSSDGDKWTTHPIKGRYKDGFTGLKDKNGKEIYENDIIDWAGEHKLIVKWTDYGYRCQDVTGVVGENLAQIAQFSQVIGNTYESK